MNLPLRKYSIVIIVAVALVIGAVFGAMISNVMHIGSAPSSDEPEKEQDVLYWYDPMYPQQRFDQPGPSPFMDMDLVPRYADSESSAASASVQVDAAMIQSLGMRTALVEKRLAFSQLDVSGQITFNERSITRLQNRRASFVEKVWPLAAGDQVKKGQPLVSLRVPEWTAVQYELLALMQGGDEEMLRAGKERARSLGMPDELINDLQRQRILQSQWVIRAPLSGVIQTLDVRAGMALSTGAQLAQINALDSVWVSVSVPPSQSENVARGDVAEVHIDGVMPSVREGRVADILPVLDQGSRNVSLRIALDNARGDLRPGLSARVRLSTSSNDSVLLIPTEALIRTGMRTLVMLSETDNRFVPVEVRAGAERGAETVIEAGLREGERVVTSGQFLLDSEASLQGIAIRSLADEQPTETEKKP